MRKPARMYPRINGWFIFLKRIVTKPAVKSMTARSVIMIGRAIGFSFLLSEFLYTGYYHIKMNGIWIFIIKYHFIKKKPEKTENYHKLTKTDVAVHGVWWYILNCCISSKFMFYLLYKVKIGFTYIMPMTFLVLY